MAAEDFQSAAKKTQPYAFNIDREVADFYRNHPEQKTALFFIDVSSLPPRVILGDDRDGNDVLERLGANGKLDEKVREAYGIGSLSKPYPDLDYSCIIFNRVKDRRNLNILGEPTELDVTDVFTFDHEIGHMICQEFTSDNDTKRRTPQEDDDNLNLKESIADAYAVIRHFQRFGTETGSVGHLINMRALEMIFTGDSGGHFTSPVVEQILADRKKIDFSALTPAETVRLARRYASAHALHPVAAGHLSKGFDAFKGKDKWPELVRGNSAVLKELGDLVLSTEVPAEFKWGAAAVRAILDGHILFNGNHLVVGGWTTLCQALDTREAEFNRQGMTFGFPQRKPPANNNVKPPKPE